MQATSELNLPKLPEFSTLGSTFALDLSDLSDIVVVAVVVNFVIIVVVIDIIVVIIIVVDIDNTCLCPQSPMSRLRTRVDARVYSASGVRCVRTVCTRGGVQVQGYRARVHHPPAVPTMPPAGGLP